MSVEAMAYVTQLREGPTGEKISKTEKLILYVLANCHNPQQRMAWPSVKTMAYAGLMSESQAKSCLSELARKEVLFKIPPPEGYHRMAKAQPGQGQSMYVFLELDPDPRLQHSLDHVDCLACQDEQAKGSRFAPLRRKKGSIPAPLYKDERGEEKVIEGVSVQPLPLEEGVKNEEIRGQKNGQKGSEIECAIRKEPRATEEQHKPCGLGPLPTPLSGASDASEAGATNGASPPDPRHKPIELLFKSIHAKWNQMPPELVPWDGREGAALGKLLREKPRLTVEQAERCIWNFYRSDKDFQQRPARTIPVLLEFWTEEKNQYGTARSLDKDFRKDQARKAEASMGVFRR